MWSCVVARMDDCGDNALSTFSEPQRSENDSRVGVRVPLRPDLAPVGTVWRLRSSTNGRLKNARRKWNGPAGLQLAEALPQSTEAFLNVRGRDAAVSAHDSGERVLAD